MMYWCALWDGGWSHLVKYCRSMPVDLWHDYEVSSSVGGRPALLRWCFDCALILLNIG